MTGTVRSISKRKALEEKASIETEKRSALKGLLRLALAIAGLLPIVFVGLLDALLDTVREQK